MLEELRQLVAVHRKIKSNHKTLHQFGAHTHEVAVPITFTPFASVKPCSARCLFCSETLQTTNQVTLSASLRPDRFYFDQLRQTLTHLHGLPIGISLSGLEATDDPLWLMNVCTVISQAEQEGLITDDKVLYTNGNGFLSTERVLLRESIRQFGLDRIELSRHHSDETVNQRIMRFKTGHTIRQQTCFESVVNQLITEQSVNLICILQKGGVATVEDVTTYLNWAHNMGVRKVVFRELSKMGPLYKPNLTYNTIQANRVDIAALLIQILRQKPFAIEPPYLTEGYYYWNVVLMWNNMVEVTFEVADYEQMHKKHDQSVIYKLVYHANGNAHSHLQCINLFLGKFSRA